MGIFDKKIEYFIAVVNEGSFSAAAKSMYMSQANLSKQIAILEKEMGMALFDRSGYRATLTKAGEYLYQSVSVLKNKESAILDEMSHFILGNIKAGFTGVFENRELIDAVRLFQENHPDNEVELNRFSLDECGSALENGQIDVCFGLQSSFRRYENVYTEILHGYDICFVCTKNHPLAKLGSVEMNQLKNEQMIILSKKFSNDYYIDFMEACDRDGYKPIVKKEVDSFEELILSVCLGEGVALCGASSVRDENLVAIPIKETSHAPNYVMAYRQSNFSPSTELFIKFIRGYFEN